MLERTGCMWAWAADHPRSWLVITTNIGWKKDGVAVMGAGVAATAAELYPALPIWYGLRCQRYKADTAVCPYYLGNLIMFPTKPFNAAQPWLSWQSKASLGLIERSTIQLQKLGQILGQAAPEIVLPLVGCANGKLERQPVLTILRRYLDDRFILIEQL